MAQFSISERKVMDYMIEQVNDKIYIEDRDISEKEKLLFVMCQNDEEKNILIQDKIAEYHTKIISCDKDISIYLSKAFNENSINEINIITEEFLICHYEYAFVMLAKDNIDKIIVFDLKFNIEKKFHSFSTIENYIAGIVNVFTYKKYIALQSHIKNASNYEYISNSISESFNALFNYMEGGTEVYEHFDFEGNLTKLIKLTRLQENRKYKNWELLENFTEDIISVYNGYDNDKEHLRHHTNINVDFISDCESLINFNYTSKIDDFIYLKSKIDDNNENDALIPEPEYEHDEWTKNFEKNVSELHRREFKEVGGVKIEFTSSNQLLKDLEFNYPLEHAPLSYYHTWKEDLKYLKIEIMDNLMMLPETAKIHYLDRLKYQFTEKQSAAFTTEQEYFQLLSKYNTNKEDIIDSIDYNNKIFEVVRSDVPSFHESMEPDFFPDTTNIQLIFYNYQFGEAIKEAISFIDEQLNTRTEKNKKENEKPLPPKIVDNTTNSNLALDNLLESLRYKTPHDIGPFESLNIWDNNLRAFFREVLHNLSEKLPDNKKHYLDLVNRELKEKEKNVFISDEQYDSLLADFNFDRETILNTYDSDNQLIGALASKAIILEDSMPPGYSEYEQDSQHVFFNFHYGQTLQKALDFINKQYNGIGKSTSLKNEILRSASNNYNSFQYKQWSHRSESITELLNFLKEKQFISTDTEISLFRQLFKNQIPVGKIVWLSNITNLSYFIKMLTQHTSIEDSKKNQWFITVRYFELADGSEVSNHRLSTQKIPANTFLLDKALKIL